MDVPLGDVGRGLGDDPLVICVLALHGTGPASFFGLYTKSVIPLGWASH